MLNSLLIENFRSLERLEVPKLGKVNLIVGKNNSGKSSVLDALKIYASFVDETVLVNILDEHDEFFILEEDSAISPYESLFYGRRFKENHKITIGELTNTTEVTPLALVVAAPVAPLNTSPTSEAVTATTTPSSAVASPRGNTASAVV